MDIEKLVVQLASEDPEEVRAGVESVASERDRLQDSELAEVVAVVCLPFPLI